MNYCNLQTLISIGSNFRITLEHVTYIRYLGCGSITIQSDHQALRKPQEYDLLSKL